MFPALVSTNVDGYKSVNYIGLIPVMIESIKEQQKQIEKLEMQNQQIDQIIKENEAIKILLNQLIHKK